MPPTFQAYKDAEPELRALLLPTGLEVDVHPIYGSDLYYSDGLRTKAKLMFIKKESEKVYLKFIAYLSDPIVYTNLMYTTTVKRNAAGDYPQITGEARVEGDAGAKWRLTEEQLAIVEKWMQLCQKA
jgi:hypothetical protein